MLNRIAQILTIAMLSLPAQAVELYHWQPIDPPKPAPGTAFSVAGENMPVNLADYKGTPVLLNFWATWCPPCVDELPTLAALEKRYSEDGLVVLAVSIDAKPFHVIENFLSKQNIAHPLLGHDPESQLHQPLRSYGLPVSYLIDRDGMLRYRFDGATDWTQMKHAPYFHEVLKAE